MGLLVTILTSAVLALVGAVAVRRNARRRSRRHARGRATKAGYYVRGQHAPYPSRWRAGRARSDDRPLTVRPWNPLRRRVPLGDLTLLRREQREITPKRTDTQVLRLRDPLGGVVELATERPYARLAEQVLYASGAVVGTEPPAGMAGGYPTFDRVDAVVRERAARELWYARFPGDRVNRGVRLRRIAGRGVFPAAAVLASVLGPLGICWPAVAAAVWLDEARASLATATVRQVDEYVTAPLSPRVLTVTVEGHEGTFEVASLADARPGDLVAIRYDPADPSRARLAGPADGVRRGVTFVLAWAAVAAVVALGLLARAARQVAAARRARLLPPRTVRYAVTRDGTGTYLLLLGDLDDPMPRVAVDVGDVLPEDVPVSGTAVVYGELAGGRRPLVLVGARELYPDGRAVAVDEHAAARLAGGGTLADSPTGG